MGSHSINQSTINPTIVKINYTQFLKTTRSYLDIGGRLKKKMKKNKYCLREELILEFLDPL